MKTRATICIAVMMLIAAGGESHAASLTYAIVDYPQYQMDTITDLVDHVSGTIIADPDTNIIDSASFTITGQVGTYTVASATFDPYYVHITPTQILVSPYDNDSPYGYGNLRLTGTPSGSPAFEVATLQWYTPSDPWIAGNNTIAAYTGVVNNISGKLRGAEFAKSVSLYPPQAPSEAYPTWIVATVIPEPTTLLLLGLGALAAFRRKHTV